MGYVGSMVVLAMLSLGSVFPPGAAALWAQAVGVQPPRWQLAGAFVRRDSAGIRRFLAPDVMIWPPAPDTARRGSAAIAYFQRLAVSSSVSRSAFRPRTIRADGAYLVEEGDWTFTYGRTRVRTRYDLRWRRIDGRWRVSFLRWDLFR
jgi:ketosteroid isomerase-like protein